MIETRLLEQFIAVAETLNFRRAAERLHISQPPLSYAIRKLEGEIGFPLFIRNNRSVRLTAAGQAFLIHARQLLDSMDSGVAEARRIAQGQEGQLRISFVSLLSYPLILEAIRAFRQKFPLIDLSAGQATTQEQINSLENGNVDVCFMREPGVACPKLAFELLWREKLGVVLPSSHSLAAGADIDLAALKDEDFVATPRNAGQGYYAHLHELCASEGFSPQIVQEARQITTIIGLVACGFGVAIVPESYSGQAPAGVVFRPLSGKADKELLSVKLLMAWNKDRSYPPRETFMADIRARVANPPSSSVIL